ncbi:hypothetical protein [Sinorhizobium sp. BG8]|uniref:hypothetical protein n=1 Tax=Sinorhizobium sp. BG8 TaxID=2613773 RepID=UPI00193E6C29|nr:hypothetical protein [Sinorhizobium sp. BG8]QRM54781.1 hypothetical protein F3Y30_09685 [Sinorhizobium sp. BG8]
MVNIPALVFPIVRAGMSESIRSMFRNDATDAVVSVIGDSLRLTRRPTIGYNDASTQPELFSQALPMMVGLAVGQITNMRLQSKTPRSGAGLISVDAATLGASAASVIAILGYDEELNDVRLLGFLDRGAVYQQVKGVWKCPVDSELFRDDGVCPIHGEKLEKQS